METATRSPTEPSPVMGLKGAKMVLLRREFSAMIEETGSVVVFVIPAVANFVQALERRGWFHVEFRSGRVDDFRDDEEEFAVWVSPADGTDTTVYFEKHLALGGSHGVEDRFSADDGGDYGGGTFLGDPEPWGWRVDESACDDVRNDVVDVGDETAESTDERHVSFAGKSESRA